MTRLGIGLLGNNGHQIEASILKLLDVDLVGVCGFIPKEESPSIKVFSNLESMLLEPRISLISVCASRRDEQYKDILKILQAGKHVLAEKPMATQLWQLDEIMGTAKANHVHCLEMAGTKFESPYQEVSTLINQGKVGQVIQIFAQKSYPMGDWRPQDEGMDGGLILQNAIYGIRFVEQVVGQKIRSVSALETSLGNPVVGGGLMTACSLQMELEGGAIATVIANYLNPKSTNVWGNEVLQVFGSQGLLKTDAMEGTIKIWNDQGYTCYTPNQGGDFLGDYVTALVEDTPPPLESIESIEPTKWAILAKESAKLKGVPQGLDIAE